jgi:hypothetical protein
LYNDFDPIPLIDNSKHALFIAATTVKQILTVPEEEMKKLLLQARFVLLAVLLALPLMVVACGPDPNVQVTTPDSTMLLTAPGPNPMINQPDALGRVARAGAGLWHGIIAPITLVISFFDSGIHMYEVHNAGSEYDLGFLIGVILIISLLGHFIRMRR